MSFLGDLLYGIRKTFVNSVEYPSRSGINILGNVTAVDNPGTDTTDVTISAGAGVINLSNLAATSGVLSNVRQAPQNMAGDVTGTTAANAVETLTGNGSSVLTVTASKTVDAVDPARPITTYRVNASGAALAPLTLLTIPIADGKTYQMSANIITKGSTGDGASYILLHARVTDGGVIATLGADTDIVGVVGSSTITVAWPGASPGNLTFIADVTGEAGVYSLKVVMQEVG